MYSGTTFRHKSGNILGVHQKIDRAALRLLKGFEPEFFPVLTEILHFEGKNGPDGIKRKNPGLDEPWHFIDPSRPKDGELLQHIDHHQRGLEEALRLKDHKKAAFEAAWLAHAVVDGLTPAHHFPLEEHLEDVRGEPKETRNSVKKKLLLPGSGGREKIKNNWEFWGAKGVMTSHLMFELGVASAITPFRSSKIAVSGEELKTLRIHGFERVFLQNLEAVSSLHMYEEFIQKGWTPSLARQTRKQLVPCIVSTVAISWLAAVEKAKS